ncbi:MAG: response regulator [Nitrospirota bacterium]
MKRILLADDELLVAMLFKDILEDFGHEVIAIAHSGKEAIKQTCELQPDFALLDINMEYRTAGIDACKSIKEKCPDIKVYFLSAYSKDTFNSELAHVQYDGYIDKIGFEDTVEELLK